MRFSATCCPKVESDLLQHVAQSRIRLYATCCTKSDPILFHKVASDFVQHVPQSRRRFCATSCTKSDPIFKCHLQPNKCSVSMNCNCGTLLIRITHAQNSQLVIKGQRDSFMVKRSHHQQVKIINRLYGSTVNKRIS